MPRKPRINTPDTSNSPKPLISIIIASLNRGDTLENSLKSVVEQDYPQFQLIVIDGGSQDESVEILQKYQDSIDYWVSKPDRGIGHAWNKGLAHARGDWICFLGADDVFWDTTVLTRIVAHLVKQPQNIRVVYGGLVLLSRQLEIINIWGEPWEKAKKTFLKGLMIPHPGTMHHKSLFQEHGSFDEQFEIAMDYDLLLRELKHNDAYFIRDFIGIAMLEGGVSDQAGNRFTTLREAGKALNNNGLTSWSWFGVLNWSKSIVINTIMRPLLGDRITENIRNRILLYGKDHLLKEIGASRPPFFKK